MNDKMYKELLRSVQEMDRIRKDKKRPSRRFIFKEPKVKQIREQTPGCAPAVTRPGIGSNFV